MNDFLSVLGGDDGELPHDTDALAERMVAAIRTGRLRAGSRLPTVQQVANDIGVSPSTVTRAWSNLKQMGMIQTRRRGGTTVTRPSDPTAYRFRGQNQSGIRHRLAAGYPDPELTLDLGVLLRDIADQDFPGYVNKDRISDDLYDGIARTAGYRPETVILASDVIGMLHYVLRALVSRGGTMGVAEPEFPLYTVVLRQLGLSTARIGFGDDGYDVADVERVLAGGVKTLLIQGRVHTPTGRRIPEQNVVAIAELLERHDAFAVEIDHHGALVPDARLLAAVSPHRVVLMSSFAKSFHPDLRVAPVTGPERIVSQISAWRSGGAWVSNINKALLEAALTSPATDETVARARDAYGERRRLFHDLFAEAGREIRSDAGLHMWVPVEREQAALIYLASKGISVSAGSGFHAKTPPQAHVYLSLGLIGSDPEYFARTALASATYVDDQPGAAFL